MCLTSVIGEPLIAKEDIKVYKVLEYHADTGHYVTPYYGKVVKSPSDVMSTYDEEEDIKYSDVLEGYEIGKGFIHSFLSHKDTGVYYNCVVVKGIIPKGTEYYVGCFVEDVCSKELRLTGIVNDADEYNTIDDENMKVALAPLFEKLSSKDKPGVGWLVLNGFKFTHPLECSKEYKGEVIGIVYHVNEDTDELYVVDIQCKLHAILIDDNDGTIVSHRYIAFDNPYGESVEKEFEGRKHPKLSALELLDGNRNDLDSSLCLVVYNCFRRLWYQKSI